VKVRKEGGSASLLRQVPPDPVVTIPLSPRRSRRGACTRRQPGRPSCRGQRTKIEWRRQIAHRRHVLPRPERARRPWSKHRIDHKKDRLSGHRSEEAVNAIDAEYDGEVMNVYVENGQNRSSTANACSLSRRIMFKKILIANRRGSALRIIFACRELGIQTVDAIRRRRELLQFDTRYRRSLTSGPARSGAGYLKVPGGDQRGGSHRSRRDTSRIRAPVGERLPRGGYARSAQSSSIGPDQQGHTDTWAKRHGLAACEKAGVTILPAASLDRGPTEKALKIAKRSAIRYHQGERPAAARPRMRLVVQPAELRHAFKDGKTGKPRRDSASVDGISAKYVESPRHIDFRC